MCGRVHLHTPCVPSGEPTSGLPARRWHQNIAEDATNASSNFTNATSNATSHIASSSSLSRAARIAREQRAAKMMNATDSLGAIIGRGLVLGERQVQVQSPKLTMGVSIEDPCKPAGDGAALHDVPPLQNGVRGSFYLPPGSMCERGIGEPQADDPIAVSVALFNANAYSSAASDQTGTPLAAVKMRRSSGDVAVRNRSEVMLYCNPLPSSWLPPRDTTLRHLAEAQILSNAYPQHYSTYLQHNRFHDSAP